MNIFVSGTWGGNVISNFCQIIYQIRLQDCRQYGSQSKRKESEGVREGGVLWDESQLDTRVRHESRGPAEAGRILLTDSVRIESDVDCAGDMENCQTVYRDEGGGSRSVVRGIGQRRTAESGQLHLSLLARTTTVEAVLTRSGASATRARLSGCVSLCPCTFPLRRGSVQTGRHLSE